ncbi:MAG: HU family DNA-binding protein [Pelagimonas sp.]|uniref:HU family DNA-binding protein n=1 Tax=Pelagimonas sp. TaxID=2073170 RepID=UPI003D6A3A85
MAITTRKTTRSTTASKAKTEPKDQTPMAPEAENKVQFEEQPVSPRDELKKKELIELAVERSGIKKRDAKPAIEAALAILGEALAEAREINMRPMGKIKVNRIKKGVNGQVIIARIRQPETNDVIDLDPLAQAAE